jgi:hypothetical protein
MIREHVLTISTLLGLMALSGVAQAGPRITDKSYWLNEVRNQQAEGDWRGAYALERGAPIRRIAPPVDGGQYQCRYQGGPKSPMWCSR